MTPADFGKMIADYDQLTAEADKIDAFATMVYTADMADERKVAFYEKTAARIGNALEKTDFFESEIAALPDKTLNRLMTDETARKYGFWIEQACAGKVGSDAGTRARLNENADQTEKALLLYDKTKNEIDFRIDGEKVTSNDLYAMAYSANETERRRAGAAMNAGYASKADVFADVVNAVALKRAKSAGR